MRLVSTSTLGIGHQPDCSRCRREVRIHSSKYSRTSPAVEGLPRILLGQETCESIVCYLHFLVSLVGLTSLCRKKTTADISSDIAFYGVNLNQSIILTHIGYGNGKTPWQTLQNLAIGNIIVSAAVG